MTAAEAARWLREESPRWLAEIALTLHQCAQILAGHDPADPVRWWSYNVHRMYIPNDLEDIAAIKRILWAAIAVEDLPAGYYADGSPAIKPTALRTWGLRNAARFPLFLWRKPRRSVSPVPPHTIAQIQKAVDKLRLARKKVSTRAVVAQLARDRVRISQSTVSRAWGQVNQTGELTRRLNLLIPTNKPK